MSVSSEDSSGLSSTSTTTSINTSGLSSASGSESQTRTKAKTVKSIMTSSSTQADGVPLPRAFLWVVLVSVIGFLWGQQLSHNGEIKAQVQSIASFLGMDTNDDIVLGATNASTYPLLQQHIKEHEAKIINLPTFSSNSELEKAIQSASHKEFAEFIVNPVLLAAETPANSVAIAVNIDSQVVLDIDGIDLAKYIVDEVALYKDIEEIKVLLVSSKIKSQTGCPPQLSGLDSVECIYVDPLSNAPKTLPETVDVSIVLSGCNSKDKVFADREWEYKLYDNTESIVSTCSAPVRPFDSAVKQQRRIDFIFNFFIEEAEKDYAKILDYQIQDLNMVVAFQKNEWYRWHLNEAMYSRELYSRLIDGARDSMLNHLEAPDMLRKAFPPKHSFHSYCIFAEDEDGIEHCNHPFDPNYGNIPTDKLYVAKSKTGENAGRGVFTSLDILEENTYIGIEQNIHRVYIPGPSKRILFDLLDYDGVYDNFNAEESADIDESRFQNTYKHPFGDSVLMTNRDYRSLSIYNEAYGFDDDLWGISESNVYTSIQTFVNHGCNGTANIGVVVPGFNEFTIDVNDFEIPTEIQQFEQGWYAPHRDRAYPNEIAIARAVRAPILKGGELLDNYLSFGGDTHFKWMVLDLLNDCSGGLGTVERQQIALEIAKQNDEDEDEDDEDEDDDEDDEDDDDYDDDDDDDDDDDEEEETPILDEL